MLQSGVVRLNNRQSSMCTTNLWCSQTPLVGNGAYCVI